MAKYKVNWHLPTKEKDYRQGDVIEREAKIAAPYVAFGVLTPLDDDEDTGKVDDLTPAQLKTLNKDQIAEYAKKRFGIDLKSATKDAMLAAITVCVTDETKAKK